MEDRTGTARHKSGPVSLEGFEPPATSLGARHSILLNYRPMRRFSAPRKAAIPSGATVFKQLGRLVKAASAEE